MRVGDRPRNFKTKGKIIAIFVIELVWFLNNFCILGARIIWRLERLRLVVCKESGNFDCKWLDFFVFEQFWEAPIVHAQRLRVPKLTQLFWCQFKVVIKSCFIVFKLIIVINLLLSFDVGFYLRFFYYVNVYLLIWTLIFVTFWVILFDKRWILFVKMGGCWWIRSHQVLTLLQNHQVAVNKRKHLLR